MTLAAFVLELVPMIVPMGILLEISGHVGFLIVTAGIIGLLI